MTISTEHLAELLAGIARSQQALVDAIERSDAGWRNTHLIPTLTVAANTRAPDSRLIDLPSRLLLRYQGRAAIDTAAIAADLERLFSLPANVPAATAGAPLPLPPAAARAAAKAAAASASPSAAPPASAPPTASPSPSPSQAEDNLDFSKRG